MTTNKNEESLYVMINYPDQRKRFTVFYNKNENEKEGIVLIIPPALTFSGFLGLLINKFKLDGSNITKSHIRVRTIENDRRIKSLDNTYNNQILSFTISTILDDDPDNVEEQKSLTISQEHNEKLKKLENGDQYLCLFKDSKENKNHFYRNVIDPLIQNYSDGGLVIGESYPYRCKLLISDHSKDSRIWLYLIEKPTTTSDEFEYTFNVASESNENSNREGIKNEKRNSIILELMNQQYQQKGKDVIEMVKLVEKYYMDNYLNPIQTSMLDNCINLFEDLETVKSVSQNVLFSKMFSTISNVSNHFNVTHSLARKLLFNSKWDEKATMSLDEKSIRLNSFPHKTKDISLFKFNSLLSSNNNDKKEASTIECSICYCDYASDEMIELVCGHRYCIECMSQYFKASIQDGNGGSNSICCPTTGCLNRCIDDVTIETLSMEHSKKSGSQNLVRDVLFSSNGIHQCPVDGCGRVVLDLKKKNTKYAPYISCLNHTFCLYCKKEGLHWPIRCNRPIYNEEEDLFSYSWIIKNTTICLRCKFPIEKSAGCNHMKCSRCRFEFCYSCGQDYNQHGTCTGSEIDLNLRNKSKIFFDTINDQKGSSSSVDTSFIEEFFKGNFHSSDPLVKHIYSSIVTLITERNFADKRSLVLLQNAAFHLYHYNKSGGSSDLDNKEKVFNLKICQQTFKKLLSNVVTNGSEPKSTTYETLEVNKNIRSLSVIVCTNGSKKQLFNVFVNSKFNEFKEEITTQLNKSIPNDQVEYDAKKIRIYNLYGGQIKSVNEIIDKEPIFITSSIHETWIEPQIPTLTPEEIEKAQLEIEKEQIITIEHGKNTFTTLKPKKSKIGDHKLKLKQTFEQQLKLQEKLKLDQQPPQDDHEDNDHDDHHDDSYEDDHHDGCGNNLVNTKTNAYEDDEDDSYDDEYYDEEVDEYEDEIQDEIYKKNKPSGWY